jgi:pimeloyl-ACP methyl ester carboxylesterase
MNLRRISISLVLCLGPAIVTAGQPDPSLNVYARPQKLVDIGSRRLNLYCLGHGTPTVILDGGLGRSTVVWRKVHAELAKTTRVCAYDRSGYGFSDPGPLPRDTRHLADDLAVLTRVARLPPPYVLVGASLGGMIVRLYADTHLREVGGMVLVDPETEHEEKRLDPVSPGFIQRMKRGIERDRACLKAVEAGVPAPGSKTASDCVLDPDPELPSAVNDYYKRVSSHPPFFRETLSEEEQAFGAGSDQIEASRRSYGALPLIVLTSTTPESPDPEHPDPCFDARTKVVIAMHEETARLSSRGVNRTIPGATHHIMLTAPRAVIDAVDEVVADVRQEQAAARRKY